MGGGETETTVKMSGLAALQAHGPYDFIRDDASHVASDMIRAFETLFTTVLRPGGVYVIEDTWTYPVRKTQVRRLMSPENLHTSSGLPEILRTWAGAMMELSTMASWALHESNPHWQALWRHGWRLLNS